MSVVFLVLSVLTGFLAVRIAWPGGLRWCRHDVLRLSLGAGIGLAIASVVTFVVDALAGGSTVLVASADGVLFAAALGSFLQFRRLSKCPFCGRPKSNADWPIWVAAVAAVASAVVIFCLFSAMNPYGEWDAWAIWNKAARFLASGPSWTHLFGPAYAWAEQDYPLLVPGAIANFWMAGGSTSPLIPSLVGAVFLFGGAGVLFGTLDLIRNRAQALNAMTALFGAAAVVRMGASQYADIPLAFFYIAALGLFCISDSLPDDAHSWWLAGLAAGCAAWTKNEGLLFVAVALVVRAVVSRRDWKRVALMLAGAAPLLAIVAWFKFAYAPPNYLFTEQQSVAARLGDVSRYMTVVVEFGRQALTFGGWLVPPVIVAIGYAWLVGRTPEDGSGREAALYTLIAMTIAYAGVYVVTNKDLNWQLETSLARVLAQLWPAAVLVYFAYMRAPGPLVKPPRTGGR